MFGSLFDALSKVEAEVANNAKAKEAETLLTIEDIRKIGSVPFVAFMCGVNTGIGGLVGGISRIHNTGVPSKNDEGGTTQQPAQ